MIERTFIVRKRFCQDGSSDLVKTFKSFDEMKNFLIEHNIKKWRVNIFMLAERVRKGIVVDFDYFQLKNVSWNRQSCPARTA
ncbi:MAG: hypothetical protein HPY53_01065 [Brevinematales bacterium]|nr:hypothetical protein [Brevinematales bacterium]